MADGVTTARSRGRPAKRQAIQRAARAVFGRDGYARASIDVIAAEAGVSTRTLYNHFGGKDDLFASTIEDSARRVADTLTGIIRHHLDDPDAVTDLPPTLTALATAWVRAVDENADHFAMVRQITAEAGHVPSSVLERWDEAGPLRVARELSSRIDGLAQAGLLEITDASRAASHFLALTVSEVMTRSYYGAQPVADAESADLLADGVRAFLHGYLPRGRAAG